MKYILAKKKQMDQIFNEGSGKMVPVTVVEAGPCFVSQVKTQEKDGYRGAQIVFGKKKSVAKPQVGHLKNIDANAFTREIRLKNDDAAVSVGAKITAGAFEVGDVVGVTGVSKGRGFQGVVKRHNFKGSLASHGHKDQLRMPGSIGATDPARVFKGTRMGGHMGDVQVTTKGLVIEKVDAENNRLYIRGAVPGAVNGYLIIKGDGDMTIEAAAENEKKAPAEDTKEERTEKKEVEPQTDSKEGETRPDNQPVEQTSGGEVKA